ncbi:hypothetical protein THAOC_34950, partial [Thalassiosira oceanica]
MPRSHEGSAPSRVLIRAFEFDRLSLRANQNVLRFANAEPMHAEETTKETTRETSARSLASCERMIADEEPQQWNDLSSARKIRKTLALLPSLSYATDEIDERRSSKSQVVVGCIMESVEVELDQTVGHDGESLADEGASFEVASLEVASLDVDPATPSRSGKYVKVGIAVASMLALGAGVVAGTMKNRNAQSKSVSALANGSTSGNALSSSANGSSDGSGGPYDCGGK